MKKILPILHLLIALLLGIAGKAQGIYTIEPSDPSIFAGRVSGNLLDWLNGDYDVYYEVHNNDLNAFPRMIYTRLSLEIGAVQLMSFTTQDEAINASGDQVTTLPTLSQLMQVQNTNGGKFERNDQLFLEMLMTKRIPPGALKMKVELFLSGSSNPIAQVSQVGINISPQPPRLISPQNGLRCDVGRPLIFSWSRGMVGANDVDSTEICIYQVLEGQDPTQALRGNVPIVQEVVTNKNLWIWQPIDSPLYPGDSMLLVWIVRPLVSEESGLASEAIQSNMGTFWAYLPAPPEPSDSAATVGDTTHTPRRQRNADRNQTGPSAITAPIDTVPAIATNPTDTVPTIAANPIDTVPTVATDPIDTVPAVAANPTDTVPATETPPKATENSITQAAPAAEEAPQPTIDCGSVDAGPDITVPAEKSGTELSTVPEPGYLYEWAADEDDFTALRPSVRVSPKATTRYLLYKSDSAGRCEAMDEVWVIVSEPIIIRLDTDACGFITAFVPDEKPAPVTPKMAQPTAAPATAAPAVVPSPPDTTLYIQGTEVEVSGLWVGTAGPSAQQRRLVAHPKSAVRPPQPPPAGGGKVTLTWSKDGEGSTLRPQSPGTYTVIASNGTRSDTLTIEYRPRQRWHGEFPTLGIPREVVPGDPVRGFVVRDLEAGAGEIPPYNAREFRLTIWRDGAQPEVVQRSTDKGFKQGDIAWDGIFHGRPAAPGTYYWALTLTNCDYPDHDPQHLFRLSDVRVAPNGAVDYSPEYEGAMGQFEVVATPKSRNK